MAGELSQRLYWACVCVFKNRIRGKLLFHFSLFLWKWNILRKNRKSQTMRTLASRISLNERVSMERAMSRIKMALIRYEKKIDILIRLNWSSIAILLPLEVVSSKTGVYTCLVQCDKVMIAESSQGNLSFSNIYGENSCSLLVISSSSSFSREDSSSRIELSVALTKSSRAKLVNREAPPVFIFYFLFFYLFFANGRRYRRQTRS